MLPVWINLLGATSQNLAGGWRAGVSPDGKQDTVGPAGWGTRGDQGVLSRCRAGTEGRRWGPRRCSRPPSPEELSAMAHRSPTGLPQFTLSPPPHTHTFIRSTRLANTNSCACSLHPHRPMTPNSPTVRLTVQRSRAPEARPGPGEGPGSRAAQAQRPQLQPGVSSGARAASLQAARPEGPWSRTSRRTLGCIRLFAEVGGWTTQRRAIAHPWGQLFLPAASSGGG